MSVKTNNPAGRLYTILDKARKANQNQKTHMVWGQALDLNPTSPAELYHGVGLLHELVANTEAAINDIDGLDKDLYLRYLPDVSATIHPDRFNNTWSDTQNKLSEALMQSLEFCAEELAKHPQPQELDPEELEKLQSDVEKLIHDLAAANLDDSLKKFLVEQLEITRKAILDYRLRGAAALREALERTLGTLIINRDLVAQNKDIPEVSRFGKIFAHLQKLVKLALKVKQLAEAAKPLTKMLPSPFDF